MSKDILGKVVRKIVELPVEKLRVIFDIMEKMLGSNGDNWFVEFKKFLRREKCWMDVVVEPFLKLIYADTTLVIKAKTGERTIFQIKDLFTWGIGSDFVDYGADEEGSATEDTEVDVYELAKDGDFSDIYGSLPFDLSQLCLTQDQIIGFVEEHRNRLSPNSATFFLFQSNNEYFVASVVVLSDGRLNACVDRFGNVNPWGAERRHRFVVPRPA